MAVRIEGLGRLRRKLGKLGPAGRDAVRREIKRAALNVQNGARERVPVDTGRLRNSIAHVIDLDGMRAVIGTNVEYAPYVELGTFRASAQPYLFPAFEAEKPKIRARLRKALNDEGRSVARSR